MRSASPYKARNRAVLEKVAKNFPVIAALVPQIWAAYLLYYPAKGDPRLISPLALSDADAANLDAIMKDCYSSGRVRDGLSWLSEYRPRHGYAHCPMCGAAHPKTLDHFLPKDHYPEFSIFALNLVPSCMSCNGHRSSSANAPNSALPMLHPFFDGEYLDVPFLYVVNNGTYSALDFAPLARHPNVQIQDRATEHVRRSIDLDLFNTWLVELFIAVRGLASRYNTAFLLCNEINYRLSDEVRLKGPNTWDAAFLRWTTESPGTISWFVTNPL